MPSSKQPNVHLSPREMATVLAALVYWREEMLPHGRAIMRPYFETVGMADHRPLTINDIRRLSRRLKAGLKHRRSRGSGA